jgi:hypothetical protein
MRTTTKWRARQLALVTLAAPVAAWALEQAAHRAEAGDQASPDTTITWRQQPPQPDQHRG